MTAASYAVDPGDVETYHRDGVVVLRGVLDADEVEQARAGIEEVLGRPSDLALVASGDDDPGRFFEDFCRWGDVPGDRVGSRRASRLPSIAAQLLGGERVRLYHDHVLVKEGGTRQRTPWHQDQPYYNVSGHGVSAWIPVDPVPDAGCLELVAGTHAGPWLMPRTFMTGEARWFPEGALAELPDIEADRGGVRHQALASSSPGGRDLLRLPHGARCAGLPVRRTPPGAVAALRSRTTPGTPSAPLADVPAVRPASPTSSPDGVELDHPLFPVVWPV